jgi:hypothetical protein
MTSRVERVCGQWPGGFANDTERAKHPTEVTKNMIVKGWQSSVLNGSWTVFQIPTCGVCNKMSVIDRVCGPSVIALIVLQKVGLRTS